eukprot:COSAG02_NODE_645_length_18947_cov_517.858712_15_plen_100_part_00
MEESGPGGSRVSAERAAQRIARGARCGSTCSLAEQQLRSTEQSHAEVKHAKMSVAAADGGVVAGVQVPVPVPVPVVAQPAGEAPTPSNAPGISEEQLAN